MMHRLKSPGPSSNHLELMGYLSGELTENLAKMRIYNRILLGHTLKDGHDPFEAPNFGRHSGMLPKNLDLVEIDTRTGEVVAIYEVKSTTTDKKEFNVNGQCGIFMSLADQKSIPTYLIVVRLDRTIRTDVLDENPTTKEITVNQQVLNLEIKHFSTSARFELYPRDQFEMKDGQFIASGKFTPL